MHKNQTYLWAMCLDCEVGRCINTSPLLVTAQQTAESGAWATLCKLLHAMDRVATYNTSHYTKLPHLHPAINVHRILYFTYKYIR